MTGPPCVLVDSSSATHCRPWENEAHHVQAIQKTHSDLVKFGKHDDDYRRVLSVLERLASDAIKVIPRGMSVVEGK